MNSSLIITARRSRGNRYGNEPRGGRQRVHYLEVPSEADDLQTTHKIAKRRWVARVQAAAEAGDRSDIVVFVHGYNNGPEDALAAHRRIDAGLRAAGYKGAFVSFDWPSANNPLNYLEDRVDAKLSALRLVDDGIRVLSELARSGRCSANVHLLGHSMGTYVIREAFDDADDRHDIASVSWTVSQVALVAADVSAASMRGTSGKSSSLYRHSVRVTNYWSAHDAILKLSNIKRIGVAPRAGRVGLPDAMPPQAVDVECSDRFEATHGDGGAVADAVKSHSWYFNDAKFFQDLVHTFRGDIDRNRIPTREGGDSRLSLRP